jgi:hemin uptake protein HemP
MTDIQPTPPTPPADGHSGAASHHAAEFAAPAAREKWNSAELLGDRIEILIQHGSEVYRLRRTRQDKLILYK